MTSNSNGPEQFTGLKLKSQQQEQVERLKQAHIIRTNQNQSPDPLGYLIQPANGVSGSIKAIPQLDQVKIIVDEEGTTIVGNYKLGKKSQILYFNLRQGLRKRYVWKGESGNPFAHR